jgi:hypothetical protein
MLLINSYLFASPRSSDADVNAYILAVESADGQQLEAGVITAVESFVVGCKSDGIWSAIKASCILAGARTLSGALRPLVGTAPTNANFVSGDYNRETGLLGNGSTKYLNANRNANSDPQNSYHHSVYVAVAPSITVNRTFLGYSSAPQSFLDSSTTSALGSRFRATTSRSVGGQATTLGFKGQSRSTSTAYTIRSGGTNFAQTVTSSATPSIATEIFRRAGSNTDARLAFYSIGESLDLALLDTRVSNLMTTLAAAIP